MGKTRRKIIYTAYKVLHQNASAPLKNIANEAGITRMTLHRYFPTRQTLVEAAILEVIENTISIINAAKKQNKTPKKQLEVIFKESLKTEANIHFLWQQSQDFQAMSKNNETFPFEQKVDQLNNKLVVIFNSLKHKKLINTSAPDKWLLHLFDAVVISAWHSLHNGCIAPNDVPDLAWKSFWNAISK